MLARHQMTYRRLTALTLGLVGLTSCAPSNEISAGAVRAGYHQEISAYYDCLSAAGGQPVYVYLSQHFNLSDPSKDSKDQRMNRSMASVIETQLLTKYRASIEACQKPHQQNIAGYTAFAMAQNQTFLLNDENLSILIDRQQSWGEYVTTRDTLAHQLPETLDKWEGEIASGQPLQMSGWQATVNQVQTELSEREGRVVKW